MSIIDPQKRVEITFGATSDRARHRFKIGPGAGSQDVLFAVKDRVSPAIHGVKLYPGGTGEAFEPSGKVREFTWSQA